MGRERAEDLLGEVWFTAFGSPGAYDRSYPGYQRDEFLAMMERLV